MPSLRMHVMRTILDDLCFQVAKLLTENHVYSDIVGETGASTATISRVNRSLAYDGNGGYGIVFDRLKERK